jgi:hypothetical protein
MVLSRLQNVYKNEGDIDITSNAEEPRGRVWWFDWDVFKYDGSSMV